MAHAAVATPAPPHSLDAEQTLLGALLLDSERMIDIAPMVSAEDFYDPLHRAVFTAATRLHDVRSPIASPIAASRRRNALSWTISA